MSLAPGTRIGPYEVISLVGAGGMGEVYRARDPKLQRDVALKVLPGVFASDSERLARFEREARMLAALNHPHIAAIHGFEESHGTRALVLEFVEGETLADRLARGRIPLEEALPIAGQVAEALEAAHEHGIIHRDLKPANIKITPDGAVKVLDFGLAKLPESRTGPASSSSLSPTITSPALMTQAGMLLGTAAYMAPEQAKGRPADKRSDIWAFGCVFYEMLTGRRAFDGDEVTDTLAAVIRTEPDWTALPDGLAPAARTLVRKCLEKDRRQRIADVSTAGFVIHELHDKSFSAPTLNTHPQPRWRLLAPIFIAVGVTGALTTSAAWWISKSSPTVTITRFAMLLGDGQRFTNPSRHVAISPDGRQVAYYANDQLYVRSMSDLVARAIPGTQPPLTTPVFSPDGASIVFVSGRTLKRIHVEGGTPATVANLSATVQGMSWHDDAILLGLGDGGIWRVAEKGGTAEQVIAVAKDEVAESPQMLPDGRSVLFTVASGADNVRWERAKIVVQAIGSATRTTLIEDGADGTYLRTGHIVFARGGVLFAVQYDPRRSSVTGSPVPVVEGVRRSPSGRTGAAHFRVSTTGTLVYIPGPSSTSLVPTDLAVIDRKGAAHPLQLTPRLYEFPRASLDGKRIAFGTDDLKEADIWILELERGGTPRQLTTGGRNRFPIWTRDGVWITFQSDRGGDYGIFRQRADGTGSAERLTTAEQGTSHVPEAWSPDGQNLLFAVVKGSSAASWRLRLRERKSEPSGLTVPSILPSSDFSPDGRWVAYTSPVTSKTGLWGANAWTIVVEPFPGTGATFPLGTGVFPVWSRNGRELTYLEPGGPSMFAVNVATAPVFASGQTTTFSRAGILAPRGLLPGPRNFDTFPDGRFIGVVEAAEKQPHLQVVLNWFEELNHRVPTK